MRRRGFSMAEVMVGLLFLSIAVLGLISVHLYSLRAARKHDRLHQASLLAATELSRAEESLRRNFDQDVTQPERTVSAGFTAEVLQEANVRPDVHRVTVIIRWTDPQGRHTYPLTAYLSRI